VERSSAKSLIFKHDPPIYASLEHDAEMRVPGSGKHHAPAIT
jgi:hypothetical protein